MDNEREEPVVGALEVFQLPKKMYRDEDCSTVYTTYDMSLAEERRMAFNAFRNDCKQLRDYVNLEVSVCHVVAHPYGGTDDKTGEQFHRVRIVMVTDKGECIACSSVSVARSLERMSALIRPLPWHPPMRIQVKMAKSKSGQVYDLIPVGE